MLRWGYNTNGLANHDPLDALDLLAELGYQSVALTIDHGLLSPRLRAAELRSQLGAIKSSLKRHAMGSVIETGARFLLDPRRKHEPTLVSAVPTDRARRVEFLRHAIDVAAALGSDCVSLWAGAVRDDADFDVAFDRLIGGLEKVVEHAGQRGVTIGFEPEPGMLIDTMARFEQLQRRLPHPRLKLTLDIGHLHCQGETPLADYVRRWREQIVNIHLEDMRAGIHEHLMFGEGEIDFPPVLRTLEAIGYRGGVHVELSRHSHEGPTAAAKSIEFLRDAAR